MTTATRSRKGVIALALIVILSFGMVLSAGALAPGDYTPSLSIETTNPYAPTHEFDFFTNAGAVVSVNGLGQTTITLHVKESVYIKVYNGNIVYFEGEGHVTDVSYASDNYEVSYNSITRELVITITNSEFEISDGIYLTFEVDDLDTPTGHGEYTAKLTLEPIE
jgi:hypothetical protein